MDRRYTVKEAKIKILRYLKTVKSAQMSSVRRYCKKHSPMTFEADVITAVWALISDKQITLSKDFKLSISK